MIKSRLKNAEEKYGLKIPWSFWGYDEPMLALIVNGCGYRFVIVYAYLFC